MTGHDFASLRAERNRQQAAELEKLRAEGWAIAPCPQHDEDACYCACGQGGPCEHAWDGTPHDDPEQGVWSVTCSRCGELAINHDLRTAP